MQIKILTTWVFIAGSETNVSLVGNKRFILDPVSEQLRVKLNLINVQS